ncbi:MAG: methyltransferase [Candidatus Eisenbacteria bacterium]|nr:methyltransferase [Candidatus Eisenbacteria bacterium]
MLAAVAGLTQLDETTCAGFRARLAAAGYDGGYLATLENIAGNMLQAARDPLLRSHLARHAGPAATLAALFCYSYGAPAADAREALGATLADALEAAGVIHTSGGATISPFLLIPLDGQWFLSDRLDAGADAVMGPGMTTLLMHRWLAAFPCERTLDLGCGAASLAIAAAARGARATATDVTDRALAMAAFNARLNAVAITTAISDVGAALPRGAFDLVLAQPPYVACPEPGGASTYLHGGRYGDELAMRFVTDSAALLAPGGTALLFFDSAVRANDPLPPRLRAALGSAPVAMLALMLPGASLDAHAVMTASSHHPALGDDFARSAAAYREHFESLGVTAISRVILVLRRPGEGSANALYRVALQMPGAAHPNPDQLAALVGALDLAALPDDLLLLERVRAVPGAHFVGEWDDPGENAPARLKMTLPEGSFATSRELGDRGWLMFGLLDGARTVGETVPLYAAECGTPPDQALAEVLGFVREGLARGLLCEAAPV